MKILIIEDEEPIRVTLQEILQLNGHTVLAAADGPEGVRLARQQPDLVLCDVGLPGLDGYGVLRAVRELPEGGALPFIFLTARAGREDQRRGMALGADDYITKPFTERDLIEAIAARVRRQQPLRERIEQLLAERRTEVGANWSHELMTPLNGLMGALQLIEADVDSIKPAELKELLGLIRVSAERQHRLARKLVLFFELERRKGAPAGAALRIAAGAAVRAAAQRAAAERPGAGLTVGLVDGLVTGEAAFLTEAVYELLENARAYSPAGAPVALRAGPAAGRYRIEVCDQGPGMAEAERAHVGAFRQFDRNHTERQGLGLGLAIARDVAAHFGGRLVLTPGADGRGLVATLDLPEASADPALT